MSLQETLLCATLPTQGAGAIVLHDMQTGAALVSFKQTSASSRCTAVVPSTGALGGVLLSAQADKAILNVYSFQKVRVCDAFSLLSFVFGRRAELNGRGGDGRTSWR